jgi:hypothetical protein
VNDELERMSKEAVVELIYTILELTWRDGGKPRKVSVRIAGLWTEI